MLTPRVCRRLHVLSFCALSGILFSLLTPDAGAQQANVVASTGSKIDLDFLARAKDKLDRKKEPVSVIVEFQSDEITASIDALVGAKGIVADNDSARATRFKAFKKLKSDVLDAIPVQKLQVLKAYPNLPMAHVSVKTADALETLKGDRRVRAIYEDVMLHPQVDSASMNAVNQPLAIAGGFTGTGTTVAVIDSGANYGHADFGCTSPGVPSTCRVNYYHNFADSSTTLDSAGHGSNVAGIVAQVAPGTRIAALNVFGANPNGGPSSAVIDAMSWAVSNKDAYNIVAVNLSMGTTDTYPKGCTGNVFDTPMFWLAAANLPVVVSSGNSGAQNKLSIPACQGYAKAVAAIYSQSVGSQTHSSIPCTDPVTGPNDVACFSNYVNNNNSFDDMWAAPGFNITAGGFTMTGTSQAAPFVSAAIAIAESYIDQAHAVPKPPNVTSGLNSIWSLTGTDIVPDPAFPSTKVKRLNIGLGIPNSYDTFNDGSVPLRLTHIYNLALSKQPGEPNHAGNAGGHSLWFKESGGTGTLSVDTHDTVFDTLLAVYTGTSVSSLSQVAANDNDGSANGTSGLTFAATSGQTYHIAVDGKNGAVGLVGLEVHYLPPANDNFANATVIGGSGGSQTAYLSGSTKQTGESTTNCDVGGSVWYRWTAPVTGQARLVGNFWAYTGTAVNSLTDVPRKSIFFMTTAGTNYALRTCGSNTDVSVALESAANPASDVETKFYLSNTTVGVNTNFTVSLSYRTTTSTANGWLAVNPRTSFLLPAGMSVVTMPSTCSVSGQMVNCTMPSTFTGAPTNGQWQSTGGSIVLKSSVAGNVNIVGGLQTDNDTNTANNSVQSPTVTVTPAPPKQPYTGEDVPLPAWMLFLMAGGFMRLYHRATQKRRLK